MYTNTKQIRANVKTSWSHPNCKFQRGDRVKVDESAGGYGWTGTDGAPRVTASYNSRPIQDRIGQEGHVVAVSCTPDGRIRGKAPNGYCERMYSRYYVQFCDGVIHGLHSHFLTSVE